ncbi:PTB domain-containing engulfment adapter protein 1-like isoform X2 [Electrophorus electricus]|uniref:PID domain-containing protein n=1 Tax=Electrophorus electricus TaxID=8005 RepID=A0A4W4DRL0_ELEEL|nr:PTB domain-containing engulfment adapter protein 1-like isoform X2 [Electrophorus electricus]
MSDAGSDSEISFSVKFFGRLVVVRPDGMQILMEASAALQTPSSEVSDKVKKKKAKVHLSLSRSGIDILEYKTKFMLYSCPLSTVSFCAVHQMQPKLFGFIAKHPATDLYHCYVFQSQKFSHLLVSVVGDAFQASGQKQQVRAGRDLVVEALRHKNNILQRENNDLKRRLQKKDGVHIHENSGDDEYIEQSTSQDAVRFKSVGN